MEKIYIVKHVPFEGPGYIEKWAEQNSIKLEILNAYDFEFPDIEKNCGVVLMGGPMSVNDDYMFLKKEKIWVKNLLDNNISLLGICLGAQIIADLLGSEVYKANNKEIGWFPVYADENLKNDSYLKTFNDEEIVFHWHGEVFDLPEGAQRLFFNEISSCQGFCKDNAAGLQFHLESTKETTDFLIKNCFDDLAEKGRFVQSEKEIKSENTNFKRINSLMSVFLNWWAFKDKKI